MTSPTTVADAHRSEAEERLDRYLSTAELYQRYGTTDKMKLWRLRRRKLNPFPEPDLFLGERSPVWKLSTVERWEAEERVRLGLQTEPQT